MSKRIGLFGGTFDPVHIGHLRSAVEMAEQFAFDELRLLPSAIPPHRDTPQVSAEHRLAMVKRAVAGVDRLKVDNRELRRDKPSYAIDTLESVRAELTGVDQLFMLIGWDAFCGLPTWHRWEALLEHCHIIVLQRSNFDSEPSESLRDLLVTRSVANPYALTGPGGQIALVWQTSLAISATQIRSLLSTGRSARFLVPDTVLNYIEAHGLYHAPH